MEISLDDYSFVHFDDAQILRERRIFLGLTLKETAERAKMSFQNYYHFENGTRKIRRSSFDIVCRVLEALELDITKFYHGDYSVGEPTYVKDGRHYFQATGKPYDEEPSDKE